jgi:hypothetical protein
MNNTKSKLNYNMAATLLRMFIMIKGSNRIPAPKPGQDLSYMAPEMQHVRTITLLRTNNAVAVWRSFQVIIAAFNCVRPGASTGTAGLTEPHALTAGGPSLPAPATPSPNNTSPRGTDIWR